MKELTQTALGFTRVKDEEDVHYLCKPKRSSMTIINSRNLNFYPDKNGTLFLNTDGSTIETRDCENIFFNGIIDDSEGLPTIGFKFENTRFRLEKCLGTIRLHGANFHGSVGNISHISVKADKEIELVDFQHILARPSNSNESIYVGSTQSNWVPITEGIFFNGFMDGTGREGTQWNHVRNLRLINLTVKNSGRKKHEGGQQKGIQIGNSKALLDKFIIKGCYEEGIALFTRDTTISNGYIENTNGGILIGNWESRYGKATPHIVKDKPIIIDNIEFGDVGTCIKLNDPNVKVILRNISYNSATTKLIEYANGASAKQVTFGDIYPDTMLIEESDFEQIWGFQADLIGTTVKPLDDVLDMPDKPIDLPDAPKPIDKLPLVYTTIKTEDFLGKRAEDLMQKMALHQSIVVINSVDNVAYSIVKLKGGFMYMFPDNNTIYTQ